MIGVGDRWFKPQKLTSKVGQRITWNFGGAEPHSVTVANGPRGFSSNYLGQLGGRYSFTPTVPGHLPAHLPDPPDDDGGDGASPPVAAARTVITVPERWSAASLHRNVVSATRSSGCPTRPPG